MSCERGLSQGQNIRADQVIRGPGEPLTGSGARVIRCYPWRACGVGMARGWLCQLAAVLRGVLEGGRPL